MRKRVLIDGDGCPVTRVAAECARRHSCDCLVFCDTSHEISLPGAKTVMVSQGRDSADLALCNCGRAGDIVITQDYGLAALCLGQSMRVLHQDGWEYTAENIDALLLQRHTAQKMRRFRQHFKSAPARDTALNDSFIKALESILRETENSEGEYL